MVYVVCFKDISDSVIAPLNFVFPSSAAIIFPKGKIIESHDLKTAIGETIMLWVPEENKPYRIIKLAVSTMRMMQKELGKIKDRHKYKVITSGKVVITKIIAEQI